ncbi:MAG: glycosyltransferase family 4 protein [Saprospiraceae bacterium]
MNVLQLCKKFPFPVKDGEALAVTHLAKALHELGCTITLLTMNTHKHFLDTKKIPENFNHYKDIYFADLDNRLRLKDAFFNLFSSQSYHISRFISPEFEKLLIKVLQHDTFDVIQLETLYLAPYIPIIRKYSKAKIAMRAHNVEHEIWERISNNTKSIPKKMYLSHLTKKLKKFEQAALQEYDLLIGITAKDLTTFKKMGYQGESVVVPIGIDRRDYHPYPKSFKRELSISFIGSLDWRPNQEGLVWFLDKVWEKIADQYPDLKFNVAGRNTPKWLFDYHKKNVVMHGEIPNANRFINDHSVMIVPLLSGSGMRAKILEGMALGKVVITTALGLEGIDAAPGKEVLLANTPEEFQAQIEFCYRTSQATLFEIGKNARNFVTHKYDNLAVAKQLLTKYKLPSPEKVYQS